MVHAPAAQSRLRYGKGAALFAQEVVRRYPYIGVADIAFRSLILPIYADVADDFDTRRIDGYDEHAHPFVARCFRIGNRHDDEEVGPLAIGGEPFLPVDLPVIAIELCAGNEIGRIRSTLGFGHGESGDDLVLEQRLEIPRFLFRCSVVSDDLRIAGVGRLTSKNNRSEAGAAQNLVHQAQLYLAVSLSTELWPEVAGP